MLREILIIEPEGASQKEFQRIFEATDYHATFSESEEDALLRARLFKPDLIIGGKNLFEALKADQELQHIPFILLLNLFEEISEDDRKRIKVDGIISKPLNEREVISLTNRIMEALGKGEAIEGITESDLDWKPFSGDKKIEHEGKGGLLLDEFEEEEEIIELVDVVEEPEGKISIEDFVTEGKIEEKVETPSLDSWEREQYYEEPISREEERIKGEEVTSALEKEAPKEGGELEEELFEKIELEEILKKVEELQPAIEKEWPEKEKKVLEELPLKEEPQKEQIGFEEFETALKRGIKAEFMEEGFQSPPFEGEKVEVPLSEERPIEEELEEVREEELSEGLLEKLEKEFEELEEGEISIAEEQEAIEAEELEEEVEKILKEEIGISPEIEEEASAAGVLEEIKEIEIEEPEELSIEKILEEEITPSLMAEEKPTEEIEAIEEFKEEEIPEIFEEEAISAPEEVGILEELKEVEAEIPEEIEKPEAPEIEAKPPWITLEHRLEEAISRGVQEMMQDFITKIIPEVTRSILNLTLERIEKMVKEIVPELAEKAIQEEIKRIEKGEKD